MQSEAKKEHFERYKNKLLEIIKKRLPESKIYLFGSRARGTQSSGADIDLALDNGKKIDLKLIMKLYGDIEETTIPLTVDLVDLYDASDKLKSEVEKEGILWKK